MNGDDDYGGTIAEGRDEGGGMYTTPAPPPTTDDDDNGNSKRKTRRVRRHPRPQFRSTRQARRTGR